MNENNKSIENLINFINTIPFEPEKYNQDKKKRYHHNLCYYDIEFDIDKLNKAVMKDTYLRYLDQKIKVEIKKNIIKNINNLFKYVGFQKRFESLPTSHDYTNISLFSRFLNNYDLGYENSDDNTHRFVIQEIVGIINYLNPHKINLYNNELFSMYTLSLKEEDFNNIIQVLEEYKQESETLKNYKNWADIYFGLN